MGFEVLEDPNGRPVTAKGTAEGYLRTAPEGGGPGGGDASAANQTTEIARLEAIRDRLPATGALSDVQLRATPVPVSVAALPLPTGAATEASQPRGASFATPPGAIAPAQSGVIKASPGSILSIRALKTTAGTEYLQLHNAASIGAISASTIVGFGYALAGTNSEVSVDFRLAPRAFSVGIAWALSTTQTTYTAAASDLAALDAQWL